MKIDAVVVAIIAVVSLGGGVALGSNFPTIFRGGISSQPRISLTDAQVSLSADIDLFNPCVSFGELLRDANNRIMTVDFNVVNNGDIDGFTVVEMIIREEVLASNRYFIRADTTEPKSLSASGINCAIGSEEVSVRISDISRN